MEEKRLIDADSLLKKIHDTAEGLADCDQQNAAWALRKYAVRDIMDAETVDAVPVEKYNELREAFADYVCSGVNNQAPYCKNRIDGDCVDERGWCTYRHCRGFNPDGGRKGGGGNG